MAEFEKFGRLERIGFIALSRVSSEAFALAKRLSGMLEYL